MTRGLVPPPQDTVDADAQRALTEDIGSGDLTAALLPADSQWQASVVTNENAVICGRPWFDAVYAALEPRVGVEWFVAEGDHAAPGTAICRLTGPARSLATGERTALNFLQTLSGTATRARAFADAAGDTATQILDTRKTIPGLRAAQKYAVRCGGCSNHRQGLHDAILIKENHVMARGGISEAIETAREQSPGVAIIVEVETLHELDEALGLGVDRIMVDNFGPDDLDQAVERTQGRPPLEVSGDVTLVNVAALAATGVDYISTGALTKHVQAIDLSMRFGDRTSG